LIWRYDEMEEKGNAVIYKEEQDAIKQLFFIEKDTVLITVSKIMVGNEMR
jgi:hypothetical protein